ncbi:hypothetical protein GUJ93_ZPchr0008g13375 [Zizania palustris]|uniref:Protein kinase domain-containing protein n=1 Tax=Zizania palustris TaxID=103762 RepID=A0A8J5QY73_ZIZPA|nr:hypothetical protein GUJ93_ZPchr0008g12796 [Zizania palustris]KAG8046445.1 hypothetical protein GUJ93_ZPchr0008g13375 [Zizania palustris]
MASSSAAVVPSTEEMEATAPAAVLDRGYDYSGQAEEEQEECVRAGGDDDGESEGPKAASEIDISKLEIGRVVAHGDQDVSGYLTGGTLKQHLINHYKKKLAYKEVVKLALGLAKRLSFLHSKKIAHRNVKTEKILLDSQMRLKIADFSVARVEAENPKDMTGTTGTLGYMAPEVLTGLPYNRKCDVYSFGICLWEIYCCEMPYPDLSFVDLSSAIVNKDLRPKIPKCCPRAMASIMRRCWDANPDVRPEMDEVVRLLEALDTSKGGGMVPEVKPGAAGCFCFFRRRPRGA